jgi:hypothetical protein
MRDHNTACRRISLLGVSRVATIAMSIMSSRKACGGPSSGNYGSSAQRPVRDGERASAVLMRTVAAVLVFGVTISFFLGSATSTAVEEPGQVVLLDQSDAGRLRLTEHEWRHVSLARGLQVGPRIIVESPPLHTSDGVPTIETTSPTNLSVSFEDERSPVDMSSLEVSAHKGFFSKSLTVMLRPFIHGKSLQVTNARIPTGRFLLEVSIADQAGNRTQETYRLEVL